MFSNGVCAIVDKNYLPKPRIKRKGITCIQIRQKNTRCVSLVKEIKAITKSLKPYSVPIFVNDRVDAAMASRAVGLHVGGGDMRIPLARRILGKNYIIGKTVRNIKQAKTAGREGADYVSIGPVFKTPIKKGLRPKGLRIIGKIKNAVGIPVVAIGGITFSTMDAVLASGADGVAMMRGVKNKAKGKSKKSKVGKR